MRIGKLALMTGAGILALMSVAEANTGAAATTDNSGNSGSQLTLPQSSQSQVLLAQNDVAPSNAELEARISALESELQNAEMNDAKALNNPPPAPTGWWSNTSISGRMYFDVSNIDHSTNGVKDATATNPANGATNGNGTNFDIKRFYVGIDHTFDSMFSANVTTDMTYDGTTGASQIFLKKAYLQAKFDPLLIVRVGAADMPWIPYAESIYGYRYLEKTLIDRTNFGTSSDWGVHALGSAFDGILNYDFAAINGGGYKKAPDRRRREPLQPVRLRRPRQRRL